MMSRLREALLRATYMRSRGRPLETDRGHLHAHDSPFRAPVQIIEFITAVERVLFTTAIGSPGVTGKIPSDRLESVYERKFQLCRQQ